MISFVDESIREDGLGMYVIASVVAPANECAGMKAALTRHGRFHYYRASEVRRTRMLEYISSCRLLTSAYVVRGLYQAGGQEAARNRCLRRLLLDLHAWGIPELTLESRHGFGDGRDRITIMSAINSGTAPADLTYDWRAPSTEPMLWMADAIAGTVRGNISTGQRADDLRALRTVIRHVF